MLCCLCFVNGFGLSLRSQKKEPLGIVRSVDPICLDLSLFDVRFFKSHPRRWAAGRFCATVSVKIKISIQTIQPTTVDY